MTFKINPELSLDLRETFSDDMSVTVDEGWLPWGGGAPDRPLPKGLYWLADEDYETLTLVGTEFLYPSQRKVVVICMGTHGYIPVEE